MQFSNKIQSMESQNGGAWAPFYRAREMAADGQILTNLTIGDHDIKTDQKIIEVMYQSAIKGKTGYTSVSGIEILRQEVAARTEKQTGVETKEQNVVITPGGQGALLTAHMAILNEGDKALYGEPCYPTYPNTIRAAGGIPSALPMRPELGFQPNEEDLKIHSLGARSLLFNSPNNPTGAVYTRKSLEIIASSAINHDLWVISDEVYDSHVWEGQHISIRTLPDMQERTIVVGSMSKAFAMTGFRIGWLVGPQKLIGVLGELLTITTFGVPEFIQEAALFALHNSQDLEKNVAEPFRKRRAVALEVLKGKNAVSLSPPSGAMYLMLDIRSTNLSGLEFANALLEQERIAVMPGESFGPSAAGYVRVAMCADTDKLSDALIRLANFAELIAK